MKNIKRKIKNKIQLKTKCSHQFKDLTMLRCFGRDECIICGNKWVHKEEILENLISQVEYNLLEIKKIII